MKGHIKVSAVTDSVVSTSMVCDQRSRAHATATATTAASTTTMPIGWLENR